MTATLLHKEIVMASDNNPAAREQSVHGVQNPAKAMGPTAQPDGEKDRHPLDATDTLHFVRSV